MSLIEVLSALAIVLILSVGVYQGVLNLYFDFQKTQIETENNRLKYEETLSNIKLIEPVKIE